MGSSYLVHDCLESEIIKEFKRLASGSIGVPCSLGSWFIHRSLVLGPWQQRRRLDLRHESGSKLRHAKWLLLLSVLGNKSVWPSHLHCALFHLLWIPSASIRGKAFPTG